MCGLATCALSDADPQKFLDPRTHSGSIAHEKLRTRTDADHIPLISLARILRFDNCQETLRTIINTDVVK